MHKQQINAFRPKLDPQNVETPSFYNLSLFPLAFLHILASHGAL